MKTTSTHKYCPCCKKNRLHKFFGIDVYKGGRLRTYCHNCENLKSRRKHRNTKENGKTYVARYSKRNVFDPEAKYISHLCEICDREFLAKGPSHNRCDECTNGGVKLLMQSLFRDQRHRSKEGPDRTVCVKIARRWWVAQNCCYCGRPFTKDNPKSADHILPVVLGGKTTDENISICCWDCNRSKTGLKLTQWLDVCANVAANIHHIPIRTLLEN